MKDTAIMLIKPEDCRKYMYLKFDFLIVELLMQHADIKKWEFYPRIRRVQIMNPLN